MPIESLNSNAGGKAFTAHAFHPGLGNLMATGTLRLERQKLVFESDAATVELPFSALKMHLGGNGNDLLFFQHPKEPDWTIYTPDLEILELEVFVGYAQLKQQIQAIKAQRKHWPKPLVCPAVALVALIGLVVVVFAQKDRLVRLLAERVPVAWEKNLGDSLFAQIKTESKFIDQPKLTSQLLAVTERLLPSATNTGLTFEFHILEDTNPNAFAIPGGHVFVNSGLLQAVGRPEELAGVLAHEIAHVTQRHGFRQIINSAGLYLVVQYFLGDASGLLAAIGNSSQLLLRQKYSRDFEREADDAGWNYLVTANIDPRGLIDFFKKLQAEEARLPLHDLEGKLTLFRTHPATQERMDRLEAKWKNLERKSGFTEFAPKS